MITKYKGWQTGGNQPVGQREPVNPARPSGRSVSQTPRPLSNIVPPRHIQDAVPRGSSFALPEFFEGATAASPAAPRSFRPRNNQPRVASPVHAHQVVPAPNHNSQSRPSRPVGNYQTRAPRPIASAPVQSAVAPVVTAVRSDKPLRQQRPSGSRGGQRSPRPAAPVIMPMPAHEFKPTLKIIPLGGCEEVGRNMTVFEYGEDIVLLDMGLQFPEEDMPGIDFVIPDIDYLKGKEKNIRAVIFSHGHLDHIGAAPILLERLGKPTIVGRPLTLAMVKHRLEDYQKGSSSSVPTVTINQVGDKMQFGAFRVSYFQIEHSIMDAVGVILETPAGTVIHPGDWTMDKDQSGQPILDYSFLSNLQRPTILMLESLGSINFKKSVTTETLQANLTKLLTEAAGRIIIGIFSSQVERIGWIIEIAEKLNKKVALDGFSMKMNIEIAKKLGYIKCQKDTLIKVEQIEEYPDNRIVVLCTGAQGEENAVLSRVIKGSHRSVKLRKQDTIILSSSIIPGNEQTIQKLIDSLYRQCDNVIHGSLMDIHISGHGNRDDIVTVLKAVQPNYYIPVYAHHYMLKEAAKLAVENGFPADHIVVPDNGQVIEFDRGQLVDSKLKIPINDIFVDGLGVNNTNNVVLRDRKMMAEDGMIVIIAAVDARTGEVIGSPDIISRGFVYMKDHQDLIQKIRQKVRQIVKERPTPTEIDDDYIKNHVRNDIGQFLFNQTKLRPMVLPVVIKV